MLGLFMQPTLTEPTHGLLAGLIFELFGEANTWAACSECTGAVCTVNTWAVSKADICIISGKWTACGTSALAAC